MQRVFAKCHSERVWLREFLAEVLGTFILVVSTFSYIYIIAPLSCIIYALLLPV
jgi:hypothetical protein